MFTGFPESPDDIVCSGNWVSPVLPGSWVPPALPDGGSELSGSTTPVEIHDRRLLPLDSLGSSDGFGLFQATGYLQLCQKHAQTSQVRFHC